MSENCRYLLRRGWRACPTKIPVRCGISVIAAQDGNQDVDDECGIHVGELPDGGGFGSLSHGWLGWHSVALLQLDAEVFISEVYILGADLPARNLSCNSQLIKGVLNSNAKYLPQLVMRVSSDGNVYQIFGGIEERPPNRKICVTVLPKPEAVKFRGAA